MQPWTCGLIRSLRPDRDEDGWRLSAQAALVSCSGALAGSKESQALSPTGEQAVSESRLGGGVRGEGQRGQT